MQANHVVAACTLVQTIHVLRDQVQFAGVSLRKICQRPMRRIRLHLGQQITAVAVPLPHPLWVHAKAAIGSHLLRIKLCPITGVRIAKRGHTGFGTHPRATEHHHSLGRLHPLPHLCNVFSVFCL